MVDSSADRLLHLVARALPREFRERVFDPALADLHLAEGRAPRRGFSRLLLMAECLRIGLPQHVWLRGRPTRFGLTLVCALVAITLLVARLHYAAEWRAQETRTSGANAGLIPGRGR